ncbi:bladder cancer associated transcript 1 isoform X2 [Gallus gallus]|uniref:bladder cancer associated transcript 1 isoform X2 n=1 Tax=Gallus gallus TaxID=9031 RepID=UPI001F00132B|nr:bladder cancer associated transcript 1 isoform X2 [Gallus gallus]XP_046789091.1 bladder cancer associated transcript 1 isoform X2 [Gallus gallus]
MCSLTHWQSSGEAEPMAASHAHKCDAQREQKAAPAGRWTAWTARTAIPAGPAAERSPWVLQVMPQFTFACFCGLHGFCKMKRKKEEHSAEQETAV